MYIYLYECGRRCVCTTITSIDRKALSEVYDEMLDRKHVNGRRKKYRVYEGSGYR